MLEKTTKIFIAGHKGLIGSAILRKLQDSGYKNIVITNKKDLDLTDQLDTINFFERKKPDVIILAVGHNGGIEENKSKPHNLILNNLLIQTNVFKAIENLKIKKLLFFGSSCMYPKLYDKPIKETSLFKGEMEQSSISYAIAKIAGMQMCNSYNKQNNSNQCLTIIPNSVYGINDNFNPETGHVLASMIFKFNFAKINKLPYVNLWGNGEPLREFLYSDDLANACHHLLTKDLNNKNLPINIGSGEEISILDLANKIKLLIDYNGKIFWDIKKNNGVMRKFLNSSQMVSFGWKPEFYLDQGLKKTIDWYKNNNITN